MIVLTDYSHVGSKVVTCEFGCDTEEDVASLPTGDLEAFGFPGRQAATWSTAIIGATGNAYYKSSENKWVMIGGSI